MSLELQRQRSRRIWTSSNRHLQKSIRASVTCSMSTANKSSQPNGIDVGDYNNNEAKSARSCSARPLLQEYRDKSLFLEKLMSVNDQQQPSVSSTTAAHKSDDGKELSGDRPPFNKTVLPTIPCEANLNAGAEIYVKSEEFSPGVHYSSPEIKSPSRNSFVTVAAEEPKLQQSPIPRTSGAVSFVCDSIGTLAAYSNNRFDRNEAWDISKDTRAITHRSFLPLRTPSPSRNHGERPFATHRLERRAEEYEPAMASVTASLQQDIRDGFDEEETVPLRRQYSAKRRKRSPPPLGMGSLSVTVGSKQITARKVIKRMGIRQIFLVDPDLDMDNNMAKGNPKEVGAEVGVSPTSDLSEEVTHHIIPSIETATMYNNNERRTVLPPLRTQESMRQIGDQSHDFSSLDTSPSFLGSDTHTTSGLPCGSYSRPVTTDSDAFETQSFNASQFWTSSISRASSQTNQRSGSREDSGTNNDETQCRSGAGTSFSIMAARESETDRLAWRRSKSNSCKSVLSPKNGRKMYAYGEAQTALYLTTESRQRVQGRFATWTGALEDLRPRPRPTGVLFRG
ncbi:hypothetical protein CGRA01v4_02914 [Colletotrichum graminicola]|nr:hypothetical protein CGRA01v4_02914 [Colletotrichum graminicola]